MLRPLSHRRAYTSCKNASVGEPPLAQAKRPALKNLFYVAAVSLGNRTVHQFGRINSAGSPLGNRTFVAVELLLHSRLKAVKRSFLEIADTVEDQVLFPSLEEQIDSLAMVHEGNFVAFVVAHAILVVDDDRVTEGITHQRIGQ